MDYFSFHEAYPFSKSHNFISTSITELPTRFLNLEAGFMKLPSYY